MSKCTVCGQVVWEGGATHGGCAQREAEYAKAGALTPYGEALKAIEELRVENAKLVEQLRTLAGRASLSEAHAKCGCHFKVEEGRLEMTECGLVEQLRELQEKAVLEAALRSIANLMPSGYACSVCHLAVGKAKAALVESAPDSIVLCECGAEQGECEHFPKSR